jgi:hypothetical protein
MKFILKQSKPWFYYNLHRRSQLVLELLERDRLYHDRLFSLITFHEQQQSSSSPLVDPWPSPDSKEWHGSGGFAWFQAWIDNELVEKKWLGGSEKKVWWGCGSDTYDGAELRWVKLGWFRAAWDAEVFSLNQWKNILLNKSWPVTPEMDLDRRRNEFFVKVAAIHKELFENLHGDPHMDEQLDVILSPLDRFLCNSKFVQSMEHRHPGMVEFAEIADAVAG